ETVHGAYLFSGLSAGNFTVTITDDFGCEYTDSIILVEPDPIVATIAVDSELVCYGDTDGVVSATIVSGGWGIPRFQLNVYDPTGAVIMETSAPQLSPVFNNLPAGIYTITITDEGYCGMETLPVTILDPS